MRIREIGIPHCIFISQPHYWMLYPGKMKLVTFPPGTSLGGGHCFVLLGPSPSRSVNVCWPLPC